MTDVDRKHMTRALELAVRGLGHVEPNPMVGCVVAHGTEIVGEGWHRKFGSHHAEIEALQMAGDRAAGATLYVTLEPCCHEGKTPPCTGAIIRANVKHVVVALSDPFPQVDGGGVQELQAAGIDVSLHVMEREARGLSAPYLKLVTTGRPWVIAKWAMTLDGKIATHTGHSQWISCEASRAVVHSLRGRVDGVLVGRGTVEADDPLLTARPPGPRVAARIVADSDATLSLDRQLVRTANKAPVLVAAGSDASEENTRRLTEAGVEVLPCDGATHQERLASLLDHLGKRQMTNLLVEGGSQLLGSLFDAGEVDEVHVFLAPKILGGAAASGPIGGVGVERLTEALSLENASLRSSGSDVYLTGRIRRAE